MYRISEDYNWNLCLNQLLDPEVSEVMANGPGKFFMKKSGKRVQIEGMKPSTPEEYLRGVETGLVPLVETSYPYERRSFLFEGPILFEYGGSRVKGRCHIVLDPSADNPQVTITKKSRALTTIDSIAEKGSMSSEMLSFLKDTVDSDLTVVISGGTGAGKDLHIDTIIPTLDGLKTVGTTNVGDIIFDENGNRTNILKKYCPMDTTHYELGFSNGQKVKAGAGHLWQVRIVSGPNAGEVRVMTTQELVDYGVVKDQAHSFVIDALTDPVDHDEKNLPVDPYLMGSLLSSDTKQKFEVDFEQGILPEIYKNSSKEQRISLLAGFAYSAGEPNPKTGEAKVYLSSESLSKDVREVCMSLGWIVSPVKKNIATPRERNSEYYFTFYPEEATPHFSSSEKKLKQHIILGIEEIEDNPEDYFCFMVDSPSRLFLCTESYIPTHNTTMLQAMTKLISHGKRIGVAEDIPELELDQPDVTYLHSMPARPGLDPNLTASLSWVVQQFQRMRTDKIIIGETRGAEFADFLVAANSGQEGSFTTIHAENPKRCLEKMSLFALKGSDRQPVKAVNTDIAHSIDIIVQLIILPDGRHRVSSITEVRNTVTEDNKITNTELYSYNHKTDDFIKVSNFGDGLREKMAGRGVQIEKYFASKPGERLARMEDNSSNAVQVNRSSGIGRGIPINRDRSL